MRLQEYAWHPDAAKEVFSFDWRLEDGHLLSGEKPGHGADIDEKAAAKYPYERSYLDIARLHDGTMWNW